MTKIKLHKITMSKTKQRAKKIIRFILERVEQSGRGLSKNVAEEFGITRQSASRHIRKLVDNKTLIATGAGQNRNYKLAQKNILVKNILTLTKFL